MSDMNLTKKYIKLALAILSTLVLLSCALKEDPSVNVMSDLPDDGYICRVAILPFVNQTGYVSGDRILYNAFAGVMNNNAKVLLAQEGDVRKILRQMKVFTGRYPDVEQMRALAGRLGVQLLITGTVVEMKDKSRGSASLDPSISLILRIVEGDSGRTLWTTYHRREGSQYRVLMHFGKVNTVTELAKIISQEIYDEWESKGFKKCSMDK